jgi:WD40 repeat protein
MLATEQAAARHEGEVLSCAYSDDGSFVLTSGWDGQLRCWDSQTGLPVSKIDSGAAPVPACAISTTGGRWLAGSLDGLLTVWDPVTHEQVGQVLPHTRPITAIAAAPSGAAFASSSYDNKVVLYPRPQVLAHQRVLLGHRDSVLGCAFSPDSLTLLSWSTDGSVRLWDAAGGTELAELVGGDRVNCAAASPDGLWVVSGTDGGRVQLWDLDGLRIVQSRILREPLAGCFFLLGQAMIVAIDTCGRLTLFSMPNMEQLFEHVSLDGLRSCACSPFGDQVVLGCNTGRPNLLEVEGSDQFARVRPKVEERSVLSRLLGRQARFTLSCPICSTSFTVAQDPTGSTVLCPGCGQSLTVAQNSRILPPA